MQALKRFEIKIPFNKPCITGKELGYIKQAFVNGHISGNGVFTRRCERWLERKFNCRKALLVNSCTAALEITAILADIKDGDEVIMPSYTFVSTANAFVLRGAKIVFVDIRPDTMNIDEKLIEKAVTDRTRVIVPVHYAGIGCEMDVIIRIAKKYNILVVEDAAQGVMAKYKKKYLGTIGDIGCYSFHETKNYTCGEGGALILNDDRFFERAEIIREKGTDRSKYFRGEVDKYSWVDIGSSYVLSELNAAFLYAQFDAATDIYRDRMRSWKLYYERLIPLMQKGVIGLPFVPKTCRHSAHMFYIKVKNLDTRNRLLRHLKENDILGIFHYMPLHSSEAGKKYSRFCGKDRWTTGESGRIIRLPLYYKIPKDDIVHVVKNLYKFFKLPVQDF